ncbi:Estradiol 17-beta-dehydrogenase 12 [Strongyloides ratti]|uniref:Estradiol 17-beta-dehydrogenase 12 n=1 Tax=Strongyloides ratti TaxID=34506 RepID=A0A090MNV8_STRRB|nr:Estradiol 17-beta-dehydrogenase 12 [Strongyloides ratti]CEF59746.1 Estradiol 17-beta-dehydrogenase 12 [Strongyloides ratti]
MPIFLIYEYFFIIILWIILSYITYRITKTIFKFIQIIFIYVILPIFYLPSFKIYEERWIVVSGGTDGIGKAYIFELARRGLKKFVIIGRNPKKVNDIKNELEKKYNCKIQTYIFDFYNGDFNKLRQFLNNINIGFVLNSVGVGRKYLERFGDNPEADEQIIKVNCYSAAEFMGCCLPIMEKNGGGQFVVLSSSQGVKPIPLLASYSASKSFLSFICECINREYKTINVQILIPALVATNMTFYKKGSLFVVTPEAFVKQAVSTVGIIKKTAGCLNHEIQMLLYQLLPWSILKHLILPIYWIHKKRMIKMHGKNILLEKNQPESPNFAEKV